MTRRTIRDAEDARRCLAAAEESGLGRAAWAQANGVNARSLNAWRLNLERAEGKEPALRLVELVAAAPSAPPPAVEYRVRCGPFTVEVDEAFDDHALGRLLRVVAGC